MDLFSSIATLSSAILITSIIFNVLLGYVVLRSDTKSATNRLFVLLTICISVWMAVFFVSLQPFEPAVSLAWIRWSLFVTVPVNVIFYFMAYTFPGERLGVSRVTMWVWLAITALIGILTISPYAFTDVNIVNNFPVPTPGPGLAVFSIFILSSNIATIWRMWSNYRSSTGEVRVQIGYLMGGTLAFLFLMFGTVLVPTLAFQNVATVPLAPLYTLIFIGTTAYASFRHHLFNVKVIATEALVMVLCIIFFAKIFGSPTLTDRVIDSLIFIITLSFGVLLVRSVKEEIRAREEIAKLADQLSIAIGKLEESNEQLRIIDQRKSEFVSIVSHQLRTPITAIKGYSSMLLEDSFGSLSDEVRAPIDKIFRSSARLVDMVADYLNISKIEQGTMSYTIVPVDIGAMIRDLGDDFAQVATKRGLTFRVSIPDGDTFIAKADDGKIRQIFSNLIDNSIKYTPSGGVEVFVLREDDHKKILVKIKDTGIGLSQDDIHHLFGKFARGSGGSKQNTEGSGLGLYVAKKMLEAQGGSIWVDSEGPGRGSTFFIELTT